jgi:peptide-methionine (R)-S-oxide reductase
VGVAIFNQKEMKEDKSAFKERLTPEQYSILFEKGTEPPFSGKYVLTNDDGMYHCAACGAELFASENKFSSACGWPSFDDVKDVSAIRISLDTSHGMSRMEVTCALCGGHLGHVFDDGPEETTGKRFCINSLALDFRKKE